MPGKSAQAALLARAERRRLQLQLTHDFNADYAAGYQILRAASSAASRTAR